MPRATFGAIIAAWRDGYTEALARHTTLGVDEVRELFDCVVDAIADPDQYVGVAHSDRERKKQSG